MTNHITGAVVGMVVEVAAHPRGQHIWLAWIDLGDGQPAIQIVFGGTRIVRPGDLVAVAPPGARLATREPGETQPRRRKIRRRQYRGEQSHGMLCSLDELGWLAGGPDEVAILRNVTPGESLDELPSEHRTQVVVGWIRAVEATLANMVDEVLEPPEPSSNDQPRSDG